MKWLWIVAVAICLQQVGFAATQGTYLPESENPPSVCSLEIGLASCTAVLIPGDRVITNSHCVEEGTHPLLVCIHATEDDAWRFERGVEWFNDPDARGKAALYKTSTGQETNPWDVTVGKIYVNSSEPIQNPVAQPVLDEAEVNDLLLNGECKIAGHKQGVGVRTIMAPKARVLMGAPADMISQFESDGVMQFILGLPDSLMRPLFIVFGSKPVHEIRNLEMSDAHYSFNYMEEGDSGGAVFCRKSPQHGWRFVALNSGGTELREPQMASFAIPFSNPLIRELLTQERP